MPIDSSIPFQALNTPVPLMSMQQHQQNALARQMSQLQMQEQQGQMQDRQQQRNQQNALAMALQGSRGPDGQIDYDKLSASRGINPMDAMKFSEQGRQIKTEQATAQRAAEKAKLEKAKSDIDLIAQVAGGARDQQSYALGVAKLRQMGVDVGDLPPTYDPNFVQGALRQALSAKEQLEQYWKQQGYDLDVRKQGETVRHNRVTEGVSQGNLNLSRQRLQSEQGQVVETANGPVVVDRRTGQAVPVSVNGQQVKPAKKSAAGISPTLQKELIQTDEEVQAGTAALGLITKAKEASKKAYSGWGAGTRAVVASNIGMGGAAADATVDLNNLVTSQALETLKATFGGAPTEGERKILLDIQAAPEKTPAQREAILNRAQAAVERRIRLAQGKSKAIRNGKYLTEEYDPGADMQPSTSGQWKIEEVK